MSLDLYERETADRVSGMAPVHEPEAGAFDGFLRGAGLTTMRNLARTGRSIDMLGAVGPVVKDAISGGTEAQDRYFKEHDDVWGSAVDYWTPRPNEVGVAGQITGELLSMIPLVIASPALAVGSLQVGTAEDLVNKGVDSYKAQAVGAVQGVGLGLGVWMPILGQNLWQRVVIGGAGFNVAQGVATRAASGMILEGTRAADEFKAFDGQALTMDVLLGAAFGGLVHLSPAAREQGSAMWDRLQTWAEGLSPTEKAALVTLRLAQHLNVDSTPGRPASPGDVQAHVDRMRTALEQLERDQRVEVSDMREPRFEAEPTRIEEMAQRADELVNESERVRKNEAIPPEPQPAREPPIGAFRREAVAIEAGLPPPEEGMTRLWRGNRLGEVGQNPSFTSDLPGIALPFRKAYGGELSYVDVPTADLAKYPHGPAATDAEFMLPSELAAKAKAAQKTEAPAAKPGGTEPPPPRGSRGVEAAGAEASDPIRMEADRIVAEQPDRLIRVGTNADGTPVVKTMKEYLADARQAANDALDDTKLFEAAAMCLIGRA